MPRKPARPGTPASQMESEAHTGSVSQVHTSLDSDPPPIEHVTQNYVPLNGLVVVAVGRALAELQSVLRTLPGAPTDAARKRHFLQFVVGVRQEFVKLWVLCKWAAVVPEVARCVDVANWLRGRHACFDNLVGALWTLQRSLGAAKMPWADTETALEVLRYGEPAAPQLPPSFDFRMPKPLTPAKILGVLRQLDVLLAVRIALVERLPPVYRGYTIANGRARFEVARSFWLELGVADDATDARFLFVAWGMPGWPESQTLPLTTLHRLEVSVNEQLTRKPLATVLDWVHLLSGIHRLRILSDQLTNLETGLWAGVLSHSLGSAVLLVRFWASRQELRIIATSRGLVQSSGVNIDIDLDWTSPTVMVDLLHEVAHQRAKELLEPLQSLPGVSLHNGTLEFEAGSLSVDITSGNLVLRPTYPYPSEGAHRPHFDLQEDPAASIEHLRVHTRMEMLAARAEAAGWHAHRSVRLAPGELVAKFGPEFRAVLALRRPEWASGWCLAVAIPAPPDQPQWAATRLTSEQRRWRLGPLHPVAATESGNGDYDALARLAAKYWQQFALYELARSLEAAGLRYVLRDECVFVDFTTLIPDSSSWAHTGLKARVADIPGSTPSNVTPATAALEPSSPGIHTEAGTASADSGVESALVVEGCALPGCLASLDAVETPEIRVDTSSGRFWIEIPGGNTSLIRLLRALKRLHSAAQSLALARRLGLGSGVRHASLESLELAYTPHHGDATLVVKNGAISFDAANPQRMIMPFLPPLLARGGLAPVVVFLGQCYALHEALTRLSVQYRLCILPQTATSTVIRPLALPSANSGEAGHSSGTAILTLEFGYWRGKGRVFVSGDATALKNPVVANAFRHPSVAGVIPLGTGLAADVEACVSLLPKLFDAIAR